MALLTDEQLHAIREIIRRHHQAFVVNTIGIDAVPPEVLKELTDAGLINPEVTSIQDAYQFGQALAAGTNPAVANMKLDEFKRWLRVNPIPLTTQERRSVQIAQHRAAQYAVGLGNRIDTSVGERIVQADRALAMQIRDTIKTKTAENIARRETVKALASDLKWETKDWGRDWDRIAVTEKHTAMQQGVADNYANEHGPDVLVAKRPLPGACKHCLRLHLGSDGQPRIFPLSLLEANGSNYGRKAADWRPVVGSVHPNCFPENTLVTTDRGEIPIQDVQVGDLVLSHDSKFHLVEALIRSEFEGQLVRIEGVGWDVRATPNHPFRRGDDWVDAELLEEGDHLVHKIGGSDFPIFDLNADQAFETPSDRGDTGTEVSGYLRRQTLLVEHSDDGIFVDVDCHCTPIIACQKEGYKGTVYNLSVRDSESYFANGLLVHNCQCQLIRIPGGWGFDEVGSLVPGGELGERYETNKQLKRALGVEHELRKAAKNGYVNHQGIPITIETAKGQTRKWTDAQGNQGETRMVYSYGFVQRTSGADAEEIDAYVGPHADAPTAFVVHQLDPATGVYDEDKLFLGFLSASAARVAFHEHRDDVGAYGGMTAMDIGQLKRWLSTTEAKPGHDPTRERLVIPVPGATELKKTRERMVIHEPLRKAGPFIGPRGGKWADAAHTIPWSEPSAVVGMDPKRLALMRRKVPAKWGTAEAFAEANLGGFGAKDVSAVVAHIDAASASRVDTAKLRTELSQTGKWFYQHKVKLSAVDAGTHGKVEPSGKEDLTRPIVINHKGEVIDGRHRVLLARQQGLTELPAFIPAKRFYETELTGKDLKKAGPLVGLRGPMKREPVQRRQSPAMATIEGQQGTEVMNLLLSSGDCDGNLGKAERPYRGKGTRTGTPGNYKYDYSEAKEEEKSWKAKQAAKLAARPKLKVSEEIPSGVRQRISATIEKLQKQFPELNKFEVQLGEWMEGTDVHATKGLYDMTLNPGMWKNPEKLKAHEKEWNGLIVDSSIEGVVTHEMGHVLGNRILRAIGADAYNAILARHLEDLGNIASGESASVYGQENTSEFEAEAFVAMVTGKAEAGAFSEQGLKTARSYWADLLQAVRGMEKALPRRTQPDLMVSGRVSPEQGGLTSPAINRNPGHGTFPNFIVMDGNVGRHPVKMHPALEGWDPGETNPAEVEQRRIHVDADDYQLTIGGEARQPLKVMEIPEGVSEAVHIWDEDDRRGVQALKEWLEKQEVENRQRPRNNVEVDQE